MTPESHHLQIRIAQEARDGEALRDLFEAHYDFDGRHLDWSELGGNWLVAETEDEKVVAAVQVIPAHPFGFIEWLLLDESLDYGMRARATSLLTKQARATLHFAGSQVAVCFISQKDENWRKIAERRGWVTVFEGHLMLKALE